MSFLVNCGFSSFIKAKAGPVNNAALIAETSCDKRYWLISAFHSPCDEHSRWPTRWLFPCGSVFLSCLEIVYKMTRVKWTSSSFCCEMQCSWDTWCNIGCDAVKSSVSECVCVCVCVCEKQACCCMKDVWFSAPPLEVWIHLAVYTSCSNPVFLFNEHTAI